MFRGHQVQIDGFKMHKWGSNSSFPYVITIFSAPNYCGTYNNRGAVLILKNSNISMKQFTAVDAPYSLPDGLNLFSWSFPFLSEKVTMMLNGILGNCTDRELKASDEKEKVLIKNLQTSQAEEKEKIERKLHLKAKIR